MKIEVYAHKNEEFYKPSSEESSVFEDLFRETNNSGYVLFKEYAVPKETVRSVLWRHSWGEIGESLGNIELVYCT